MNPTKTVGGIVKDYRFENNSFSGVDMVAIAHMKSPDAKSTVNYVLGEIQTITYSVHMERYPVRSTGNINVKDYVMGPRTIAGTLIFAVFDKHWANSAFDKIQDKLKPTPKFLADELPPFDITISFANEYGVKASMVLYGIRLVNEGQVMSINDVYTENTYQFVATDIDYLDEEGGYAKSKKYNDPMVIKGAVNIETLVDPLATKKDPTNKNPGAPDPDKATEHKNAITGPTLSVETTQAPDMQSFGFAKFKLSENQVYGTIKLTATNFMEIIDVSKFPNQDIYLRLPIAQWTAIFIKGEYQSNVVSFTIDAAQVADNTVTNLPAPVIEYVLANSICLRSNVKEHTFIRWHKGIEESNVMSTPISGQYTVIPLLTPFTDYTFWTSNGITNSSKVIVKTKQYDMKPFDDIALMLTNNRNLLTYKDEMAEYFNRLNEAKFILSQMTTGASAVDCLIKLKLQIHDIIVNSKASDFPSYEDYANYINKQNKYEYMCMEIIKIALKVVNDNTSGNNITTINTVSYIRQPIAEQKNFLNSVLLLDLKTTAVEIYKVIASGKQLVATISGSKIYDYSLTKKACKFIGKPGTKYNAYAIGANKACSAKYEFYIMTDAEKAEALKYQASEKVLIDNMIARGKRSAITMLNLMDLSEEGKNRAIIQYTKKPISPVLEAPNIKDVSIDSVTVEINSLESAIIWNQRAYIVIAEINDALETVPLYKKIFNLYGEQIVFNAIDNGIKPYTSYAVWVENQNGEQISECATTFTTAEEDNEEPESMKLYFVNEYINTFIKNLETKISINGVLKNAIDNLRASTDTTIGSFVSELVSVLMTVVPQPYNLNDIIFALFSAKIETDGIVADDFFRKSIPAPYIDSEQNQVLINHPDWFDTYTMITYTINTNGKVLMYGNQVPAGTQCINSFDSNDISFIVYFAINDEKKTRSGLVFTDVIKKKVKSYRIDTKGVTAHV